MSANSPLSDAIRVRGARVHNLQNVDVDIPHEKLVVFTGVSGSGKSSLVFDTLFAEGRRRYLESLSTYSRQFLNQLERPDVDLLEGLPPTLSVEQSAGSVQPRSTVGTTTEIYDYLRLLYARAGCAHCYRCGKPVEQQSPQAIVDVILSFNDRTKVMLLAPLVKGRKGAHKKIFEQIFREGFVRARVDGELVDVAEPPDLQKTHMHDIDVVVDRIVIKEGIAPRLSESVDLALRHGEESCIVLREVDGEWQERRFGTRFACAACGISFDELEPRTFSFNSPYGACPKCEGMGHLISEPANGDNDSEPKICDACDGSRLAPIARSVTVDGVAIHELTARPISQVHEFVVRLLQALRNSRTSIFTTEAARLVAGGILDDVESRLRFLVQVGLDYLALDRPTNTLSGGEYQRARLAACLGSGLTGVCYILDEPTIGLHPRDVGRLLESLEDLRAQGNSVLVVEHDPEVMARADYMVDVGPGAGRHGGRVIAVGTPQQVAEADTPTGEYLSGRRVTGLTPQRRIAHPETGIVLRNVETHNLKHVTLELPLRVLTCITGVSGAGKSSLVIDALIPKVRQELAPRPALNLSTIGGQITGVEQIVRLVQVDQSPIGKTGRSNPATYSGIWNEVRKVFAKTRESRIRGYKAGRFSFNSKSGCCETCRGQGVTRIAMNFLPDLYVTCSACNGARFNPQTLEIHFRDRSVADILAMSIVEAATFFENVPKLQRQLTTFVDVGLGYLGLGQSALTLSGGEAQRVKLASELSPTPYGESTLFILDEPTTGLHPADVEQLLGALHRLVESGHTVVVVEHDLDVIRAADWVIDMGPDGGEQGGAIVAKGTPDEIRQHPNSHTGAAMRMTADSVTCRAHERPDRIAT